MNFVIKKLYLCYSHTGMDNAAGGKGKDGKAPGSGIKKILNFLKFSCLFKKKCYLNSMLNTHVSAL